MRLRQILYAGLGAALLWPAAASAAGDWSPVRTLARTSDRVADPNGIPLVVGPGGDAALLWATGLYRGTTRGGFARVPGQPGLGNLRGVALDGRGAVLVFGYRDFVC